MYIFVCDNKTAPECLERMLVGTNNSRVFESLKDMTPGDSVGLYNFESGEFWGIFVAVTGCSRDIVPQAWVQVKMRFPFQARIVQDESCEGRISADELQAAGVILRNTKVGLMPDTTVSREVERRIRAMITRQNPETASLTSEAPQRWNEGSAYIFKCDKVTGGKVFHENVMGTPVDLFKPVVSKVQKGDMIFVWVIDGYKVQKLYGVWGATARGYYDPHGEFAPGRRYPAVVNCERLTNWQIGLSDAAVRAIMPFEGSMPNYRVPYHVGRKLVEALSAANTAGAVATSPIEGKILTEDHHLVDSGAEARIDDWLFANRIPHIPGKDLPFPGTAYKCDFYLPDKDTYVEYWGLTGNPSYDRAKEQKLTLYKQHGLKLIEIFPRHMQFLPEVLPKLLL